MKCIPVIFKNAIYPYGPPNPRGLTAGSRDPAAERDSWILRSSREDSGGRTKNHILKGPWYKLIIGLLCSFFFAQGLFAEEPLSINVRNKASLQRGARFFMNYCSGCHSLKYLRYDRMAEDLGLTTFDGQINKDLLKNNLIFTQADIYSPIQVALSEVDAKQWFGMVPPDLSLVARSRGNTWIFQYLKSFYADETRPFKANNLLIPDTAMPNVLAPLIGKVILKQHGDASKLVLLQPGEMFPAEFDSALQDLVTFLAYAGEPVQLIRYRLGVVVILFLFVLLLSAWRLKKAYWKKIDSTLSK